MCKAMQALEHALRKQDVLPGSARNINPINLQDLIPSLYPG